MKTKNLYTLEFDKILDMLASVAQTEGAKAEAFKLVPDSDAYQIKKRLSQTTEEKNLIAAKGIPPFGRVVDICAAADRAEKGAGR